MTWGLGMLLQFLEVGTGCLVTSICTAEVYPRVGNFVSINYCDYVVTNVKIDYDTNTYDAYVIQKTLDYV